MKKLFILVATASLLGACNNSAKQDDSEATQKAAMEAAKRETIDSINELRTVQSEEEAIRQHTIDSMNLLQQANHPTVIHMQHPHAPATPASATHGSSPATQPVSSTSTQPAASGTTAAAAPDTAKTKDKKGLNNAAKGALIGLGTGAVAGAVIDKKHGEGAIVGGVLGAAAGAISGAILDKSKKKKEAKKDTIK